MAKFKVGDKVKAKEGAPYSITTDGWVGTVTSVDEHVFSAEGMAPDNKMCNFRCLKYQHFDLINTTQKIVITTDGRVTKAALYEGKQRIKVATATCAPSDTFDFNVGAAMAFQKLIHKSYENTVFDWDGFKAGKFNVVVNRDNIDCFLKECEEHGINWPRNKATEWNPIKSYDGESKSAREILRIIFGFESADKCDLKVNDGNLGYSFTLDMRDETIIYD